MTVLPRKKLIEVSIPLEAINKASKKQKAPKGYPTSLHTYWAPRPLAACRTVLFAQLVDDPSAWPGKLSSDIRNPSRGDTENPATSATVMPRRMPMRVSP